MPCNYPIKAYRLADGSVVFDQKKGYDTTRYIKLPCGQCVGCRIEKARQWAVRCMHEASLYDQNCFITLTYNDAHLPGDLDYSDFQKFMKRLRKKFHRKRIRFFMCGEYGDSLARPHFHACIFNLDFDDRVYFKTTKAGSKVYTSKTLDALWSDRTGNTIGFATVGDVNINSAGYVARYVMKKKLGSGSDDHYSILDLETGELISREKEFNRMSLKPGIGQGFYQKFKSDIFPHDHCIVEGIETKPPKYYTKILAKEDPLLYDQVIYEREVRALKSAEDNTPERLEVKEKVLIARISSLKRELS